MSSTPSIDASSSISSATETVEKNSFTLDIIDVRLYWRGDLRSELTSKVKQKRKGKNVGVSQNLYDELQAADVIKIYKQNQTPMVSLTDTGKQILIDSLINPDFVFDATVVAARLANGLIALIRELHQEEFL